MKYSNEILIPMKFSQIEEYFSMLPEIAIPRLGTPGERHRDRQLAIQLPKQDLARAYCRHLDPKHASSADDFMAARNEIALDIGSVQEVFERDLVRISFSFRRKVKKKYSKYFVFYNTKIFDNCSSIIKRNPFDSILLFINNSKNY